MKKDLLKVPISLIVDLYLKRYRYLRMLALQIEVLFVIVINIVYPRVLLSFS